MEALPELMTRISTLVSELGDANVPELKGIKERANPMITCYPGNGAHYVKHCDNTKSVKNGRKVTCLYYANAAWRPGDGGELRIFAPASAESGEGATTAAVCEIPPVSDRLVIFSDQRVPHEVLPAHKLRYAVTMWFFDSQERAAAKEREKSLQDSEAEREGIEREIAKFEKKYGATAKRDGAPPKIVASAKDGGGLMFEPD